MSEFEGLMFLKQELNRFRELFESSCTFTVASFDGDFAAYAGKRIMFFKILSNKKFAESESVHAFSELMACIKYLMIQDYRGLILNERSFLESCLQIINLPEHGLSTAKMFEHDSLKTVNVDRLKQIYHETSETVHHDKGNLAATLQTMLLPSTELDKPKRLKKESELKWLIDILISVILDQYSDQISSVFFVQKPELRFVIGDVFYSRYFS
ncbi:hypothetical protein [Lacticaseibacillus brantae]|nr:hypothetical protein [Lacticaseibacillus brantae]